MTNKDLSEPDGREHSYVHEPLNEDEQYELIDEVIGVTEKLGVAEESTRYFEIHSVLDGLEQDLVVGISRNSYGEADELDSEVYVVTATSATARDEQVRVWYMELSFSEEESAADINPVRYVADYTEETHVDLQEPQVPTRRDHDELLRILGLHTSRQARGEGLSWQRKLLPLLGRSMIPL